MSKLRIQLSAPMFIYLQRAALGLSVMPLKTNALKFHQKHASHHAAVHPPDPSLVAIGMGVLKTTPYGHQTSSPKSGNSNIPPVRGALQCSIGQRALGATVVVPHGFCDLPLLAFLPANQTRRVRSVLRVSTLSNILYRPNQISRVQSLSGR